MTKILLALTILASGGGAFLVARQSAALVRREANATREAGRLQTRQVEVAQNDRATLVDQVRQLKEALAQVPTVTESPLWSVLQTNRVGHLPPGLRERLFEELGFNWTSSEEFMVVSKETIHDVSMRTIQNGKLTDLARRVLALTPGEANQVQAAIQRVQTDFNDWVRVHTERSEAAGDVVADYTLHNDTSLSISNRFAAGLLEAVGQERAKLILLSAPNYFFGLGMHKEDTTTLRVKRYLHGDEPRYKFQLLDSNGTQQQFGMTTPREVLSDGWFPPGFRPIFPNGWADVAKREGFELPPEETQQK